MLELFSLAINQINLDLVRESTKSLSFQPNSIFGRRGEAPYTDIHRDIADDVFLLQPTTCTLDVMAVVRRLTPDAA